MTAKPLHAVPEHIALAIPALSLTGRERILELGCGVGVAVAAIGRELIGAGHITAVDRSEVAVRRSTERNRELIDMGRADVVHLDLTGIEPGSEGFAEESFDVIFAANVNLFWTDPDAAGVPSLGRLLRPHGRIQLFYRAPSPAKASRLSGTVARTLTDGGLSAVEVHRHTEAMVEITAHRR